MDITPKEQAQMRWLENEFAKVVVRYTTMGAIFETDINECIAAFFNKDKEVRLLLISNVIMRLNFVAKCRTLLGLIKKVMKNKHPEYKEIIDQIQKIYERRNLLAHAAVYYPTREILRKQDRTKIYFMPDFLSQHVTLTFSEVTEDVQCLILFDKPFKELLNHILNRS